jgi:uncharacterized membrane protein
VASLTVKARAREGENMRLTGPGHLVLALSMAGLGILSLIYHDYAMNWQPVPAWVPWHAVLASASGALLLLGGVGLLLEALASISALVLTIFMLSWVVLLRLPPLLAAPSTELYWLGLGETLVLMTGCLSLYALLSSRTDSMRRGLLTGQSGQRIALYLLALALPPIGLSHFIYSDATADLVPSWLPLRHGWAYLTGTGHIAAGLAILFGVVPRVAAVLEAVMMSVFTLLVWAPRVVADPTNRFNWTALCVSAALSACVAIVARSIRAAAPLAAPTRTSIPRQDPQMSIKSTN